MKHEEPIRSEPLVLERKWDKTFLKKEGVHHKKVTFVNQFGVTLAADLYTPPRKKAALLPAVAVCGPFGAVKEQAAGLYAQELAAAGFFALAFDPSFTGESGGQPRFMASPDINVEDFRAAVDFFSKQRTVDENRIALLGIGGWSELALAAAALDTRISAIVCVAPDSIRQQLRGESNRKKNDAALRLEKKRALNLQRTKDARRGKYRPAEVFFDPPHGADADAQEQFDYFRTKRGFHKRAPNCLHGWNATGCMAYFNHTLSAGLDEIQSAVLFVQGENAASLSFSDELFALLQDKNKQQITVPGVTGAALFDNTDVIPFGEIVQFLHTQTAATMVAKRSCFNKSVPVDSAPILVYDGDAPDRTAQMLAVMLNADLCAAAASVPTTARFRRCDHLVLVLPQSGELPRDILRFLRGGALKGKELLLVLQGDAAASAATDARRQEITALLPNCSVFGCLTLSKNAALETVAAKLAKLFEAAEADDA